MAGYYRNQAATDEVLRDGWLHTGDLGRFDADGRLYIVGRAKEVIVDSGGNNIYIDELEEAYGHSPYLKELAVVGLKVAQGEQVAALAVPAYARGESRRAVEDKLRAHFEKIAQGLSPHKRIRILRFTDAELPRTRTRKVKRNEVAAILRRMLDAASLENAAATHSAEIEPWLAQALAQVSSEQIDDHAGDPADRGPRTRLARDGGTGRAYRRARRTRRQPRGTERFAHRRGSPARRAGGRRDRPVRMPSYARFADPYTPLLPAAVRGLARRMLRRSQHGAFQTWLGPRILGRGNVPANRNVLVVANHSSHLDFALVGYALGAMGDELVVLAAKDYFFNTRARRFLAANFTSLIPFDRERAQLESLDDALAELAAGKSVLMFPEGTRSPDGAIHEFKSGAGYLALRSGCDVLPVLIRGTHEVLGKGSLWPRRHPVEVRIGSVITNAAMRAVCDNSDGTGAYRKLADYMRRTVLALAAPPDGAKPRARIAAAAINPAPEPQAAPAPAKSSARGDRARPRRGAKA